MSIHRLLPSKKRFVLDINGIATTIHWHKTVVQCSRRYITNTAQMLIHLICAVHGYIDDFWLMRLIVLVILMKTIFGAVEVFLYAGIIYGIGFIFLLQKCSTCRWQIRRWWWLLILSFTPDNSRFDFGEHKMWWWCWCWCWLGNSLFLLQLKLQLGYLLFIRRHSTDEYRFFITITIFCSSFHFLLFGVVTTYRGTILFQQLQTIVFLLRIGWEYLLCKTLHLVLQMAGCIPHTTKLGIIFQTYCFTFIYLRRRGRTRCTRTSSTGNFFCRSCRCCWLQFLYVDIFTLGQWGQYMQRQHSVFFIDFLFTRNLTNAKTLLGQQLHLGSQLCQFPTARIDIDHRIVLYILGAIGIPQTAQRFVHVRCTRWNARYHKGLVISTQTAL